MSIFNKPILFTIVATAAMSVGTVATVIAPMYMESTQPHNVLQKPYSPLELAGRDVYQAEGCNNCHSQTVRPLKSEILRYGPYSKAWEFEYDQPHLWGSKRTGPDLARIGGKYSDKWHYNHFRYPSNMKYGTNMPNYTFLERNKLDPAVVEARIKALDFPYTPEQIEESKGLTELDALVAYIQSLGVAVERPERPMMIKEDAPNPLAGQAEAVTRGEMLFTLNCYDCHAIDKIAHGGEDPTERVWLDDLVVDLADWEVFQTIADGTADGFERRDEGGMPAFGDYLGQEKIWSLVAYLRSKSVQE